PLTLRPISGRTMSGRPSRLARRRTVVHTRAMPFTAVEVYFCALEALQNVAKYAGATHADVRLHEDDGHLAFEVADDGAGFDTTKTSYGTRLQGMADRLAALGAELHVESQLGRGTTVRGRLPLAALEMVE